ncbi:spindle pole body interacting protein [Fistulina hepatica ATCC 64428]|uniref:Spindle pole body interacting protein n=1 Tax=Fistulina hepatica ATCC 64428 TaxID=1128425 RepID=A0A0D7A7J7_9AGAR|nr:spindle pole body interacting protein [Fistulina hepatica ATCC 64428]
MGDNHCSFVLLAEFHIFEGAQLTYQFPQPLGVDESTLAMSMLPDGAETQLDDWTVFFLNQAPFNTISPVLALDPPGSSSRTEAADGEPKQELLYVLNLVRTKHNATWERGAKVLALAICTRHPFIQIFKPVLLMALDDYFAEPSQDCLARLFDAVNSMDLSGAPNFTRAERMILRSSERKDIFTKHQGAEHTDSAANTVAASSRHQSSNSQNTVSNESHGDGVSLLSLGNTLVSTASTSTSNPRRRKSTSASSASSANGLARHGNNHLQADGKNSLSAVGKDTHYYNAIVLYRDHKLPIKMPLFSFREEVGDYSLITLVKVLSLHNTVSGPQHPHLHTNGAATHPVIVLFNALLTCKRIIFLGHKRPAGEVSTFVLSACALGSGCGAVMRGFIERAFPYANLRNRDEWESIPGYIAGVTNPIFESSKSWDVLIDISLGTVTIAKEILINHPVVAPHLPSTSSPIITRANIKSETSSEEDARVSGSVGAGSSFRDSQLSAAKADTSADTVFMDDVRMALEYHYGENIMRMRVTEYVMRFVRLASRYEEEITSSTRIGFPSAPFNENRTPMLGSGMIFADDGACAKELAANAQRIEAWRRTNSYVYLVSDCQKNRVMDAVQGFDVLHQIYKLRHHRLSDTETLAIMRALVDGVRTYDQVVELLAYTIPLGGLGQLTFGLFHPKEAIREATLDLLDQLRVYEVGAIFLGMLNHFQRFAYIRLAQQRLQRFARQHLSQGDSQVQIQSK